MADNFNVLDRALDDEYVNVSGDTMTGALAVSLAGVGLQVAQDGYVGRYLRVGSASAPANTTAGDLSVSRLDVGYNATFGSGLKGNLLHGAFTNTTTATTATALAFFQNTLAPTTTSDAENRAIYFLNLFTAGTGITFTNTLGQHAGYFENRVRSDGLITRLNGVTANAFIFDSASPATVQATTVIGFSNRIVWRPSGTSTATITTGVAFSTDLVSVGGATTLTATDIIGFRCQNASAGTVITNLIGMDIEALTRGGTLNCGLRIAAPSGATTNLAMDIAGLAKFTGDGTHVFDVPADATAGVDTTIDGRIAIKVGGVTKYIRYYAD